MPFILKVPPCFQGCLLGPPSRVFIHLLSVPGLRGQSYFFILLLLEKGREGDGEKHQRVVASRAHRTGDLACNPGMCPTPGTKPVTLRQTSQGSFNKHLKNAFSPPAVGTR